MAKVDIADTKRRLDAVSCSYCVAKWLQVTIHLQNGMTHSCHHPSPHKIPLEEIADNPTALHNTNFKKEQRRLMLEGKRPAECDYCWNIEDAPGDNYSDRHYKSHDPWARGYVEQMAQLPWQANVAPTYVEVSFSNVCNFKCSYCGPLFSSKWMEEIKQHGPYPTTGNFNSIDGFIAANTMPIPEREDNPYVEAFWKWWPDLYQSMRVFRITGGEPLLSKHTFRVLDHILEHPNPNLQFAINSNLGVPKEVLDRFIDKMRLIAENKCVLSFKVFTSVDAYGRQAEYIRHGLVYDDFIATCHRILSSIPRCGMTFMSTFNALSATSYKGLIDDVVQLKRKFPNAARNNVLLDIPYLRFPEHQSVRILTPDYVDLVDDLHTYMNRDYGGDFLPVERGKMKRIHDWMTTPQDEEHLRFHRRDFYRFIVEHDRRRGTDFAATFPEMADFFAVCKDASDQYDRAHA